VHNSVALLSHYLEALTTCYTYRRLVSSPKNPLSAREAMISLVPAVMPKTMQGHSFIHSFNPTRFQPQVPQLCPVDRLSRQPTRCGPRSAPPHFTPERAICPQRPALSFFYLRLCTFRLRNNVSAYTRYSLSYYYCVYAVIKAVFLYYCARIVEAFCLVCCDCNTFSLPLALSYRLRVSNPYLPKDLPLLYKLDSFSS
jgi:hypothetical protein